MTYEEQVEIVAREIRTAFLAHREEKYGDGHLHETWEEMPDDRKDKWRRMAKAAIEVIRS
jgi:hypothetical protein